MIIIDAGNSNIKIYSFQNDEYVHNLTLPYSDSEQLFAFLHANDQKIILSDVSGRIQDKIQHTFQKRIFVFESASQSPLIMNYKTPLTLGLDRIAAATGAENLLPQKNKLIIDLGTAITIDFVSNKKEFEGGNISPGLQTRFNSLHEKTGKLPLIKKEGALSLCGKSTEEAIRNGVIQGIIFEIERYIDEYNTIFPDLNVFLCGGDAIFFEKSLKKTIFAEPLLLTKGLHTIYTYNVKE